ncbi:hypothetical protein K8354_15805 [Polaribacter litorisediminis]|uniref:hypothetical protein n=1 Tax=Polaribacter litorisediminis TaxID=1908341 RepID=UPI001CC0CA08|nr:hypothetical protein [Polaribacter litorisediminis]UAM97742.1 hypothetical protein K8354_15805 [Polaribacter litorisediminis]
MSKRNDDLDAILEVLMFNAVPIFKELAKNAYGSEKLTKESLKDSLAKLELEDWILEKYLDKLEKDGYIEYENGFVSISNKGENFKINEGGFRGVSKKNKKEEERQEKKDWILNFDKKWRIPASIIVVIGVVFGGIKLFNTMNISKSNEPIETKKGNIEPRENSIELQENKIEKKEVDSLKSTKKSE